MGAGMLSVFGGLAFVLALVGVYGVLSYSVNQQTREIGIRMALGAQASEVRRSVIVYGLRLAAIGLLVGGVVAFAAASALSSLLYGVGGHDPLTFVTASVGLLVAAVAACYIPARRATKVDPIIALRYE
jgi:putative ABC transport system permease protein